MTTKIPTNNNKHDDSNDDEEDRRRRQQQQEQQESGKTIFEVSKLNCAYIAGTPLQLRWLSALGQWLRMTVPNGSWDDHSESWLLNDLFPMRGCNNPYITGLDSIWCCCPPEWCRLRVPGSWRPSCKRRLEMDVFFREFPREQQISPTISHFIKSLPLGHERWLLVKAIQAANKKHRP